jgi:pentatricopeptide repeat protein
MKHNAGGAGGGMSRRKLGDVNAADLLRYIDGGALDASKQIALYMLLSHMDAHLERGVHGVGIVSGAGDDRGGGGGGGGGDGDGDGDDASLDADLESRATQREERQACLRLVDALVTSRDYDGSRLIVQMLRRTPSGSAGDSNHGGGGSDAGSSTAATNGASALKGNGTDGTIAETADAGGVNGTTQTTGATGITAGNGVTGANGVTGGATRARRRTPKANGATHARAAAEGAAAVAAAEVAATASALTSGVYFASSSTSSATSAASASLSAMDALSSLVDAMEDPSGSPPTRPMDDPLAPMDVSFLVNSHLRNGQLRAARLVLQTMRKNAGVVPDRKVYMQVLNAFAGQRNWSGARLVFLDMQESGHWLDSKICTILST